MHEVLGCGPIRSKELAGGASDSLAQYWQNLLLRSRLVRVIWSLVPSTTYVRVFLAQPSGTCATPVPRPAIKQPRLRAAYSIIYGPLSPNT